jgi:hypothetical protein
MFNPQQDLHGPSAAGLAVTSKRFREATRERIANPVRFGLYLVLASTPLLAISGEVFGVVSLRTVSALFLFPLLGILAVLVIFKPAGIDRTALAGFAWGVVACAGYDLFRLPNVYVFHLWGDFFGRIGGWATGTSSNYLAGYLWRYLGDGAGIGVVLFLQAAVIGVSSWPKRRVIGFTVAFAVCPVWAGLVLTDALAPAGRALFPLNATTLALSLAGHLIYGAILGYGLWAWQDRARRDLSRAAEIHLIGNDEEILARARSIPLRSLRRGRRRLPQGDA